MLARILERIGQILNPSVFTVEMADGDARLLHGRAPHGFLEDCREIAAERVGNCGRVYGRGPKPHGNRIEFSREMPVRLHQRLRNAYFFHAK